MEAREKDKNKENMDREGRKKGKKEWREKKEGGGKNGERGEGGREGGWMIRKRNNWIKKTRLERKRSGKKRTSLS